MASLNHRVLYCDESGTNGGGPFHLGALDCSLRRAEILAEKLRKVRETHGLDREMKWTRVSMRMLPSYRAFVGVFLDDPYPRFSVTKVERNDAWRRWAKSSEERFFKTYYAFLRGILKGHCSYGVHLDHLQAKRWRWEALRWALRNAAIRDDYTAGRRLVPRLVPVDSKTSDLMQLTDILLGAMSASPSAPAKRDLQDMVRSVAGERIIERTFVRSDSRDSPTG